MKTDIEWEIGRDGLHAGDEDQHCMEKQWRWSSCKAIKTIIVYKTIEEGLHKR
ncbi:hypothetical protein [Metabacillus endolithicus]